MRHTRSYSGAARLAGSLTALRRAITLTIAVTAGTLVLSPTASASNYPVIYNFPAGLAESFVSSTPPGANIWSCRPTTQHPRPVVLVPGLSGSAGRDWQAAAPLLANNGYCVFAYDFSSHGQEAIEDAAAGLSSFVNQVMTATGTSTVDLVAHSEGGVIARYYLQFAGGAANTSHLVQISPLNHGTTLFGISTLIQEAGLTPAVAATCVACAEQGAGSPFMQKLNGNGDTVSGIRYTVIGTRNDEIITPYQSQFLDGPRVQNILLQDQCSLDQVDHLASEYDSIALGDMLAALDPAHHPEVACHPVLPGVGG